MRRATYPILLLAMLLLSSKCGLTSISTDEMEKGIKQALNEQLQQRNVIPRVTSVKLVRESSTGCSGIITFNKGGTAHITVKTDGKKYVWDVPKAELEAVLLPPTTEVEDRVKTLLNARMQEYRQEHPEDPPLSATSVNLVRQNDSRLEGFVIFGKSGTVGITVTTDDKGLIWSFSSAEDLNRIMRRRRLQQDAD